MREYRNNNNNPKNGEKTDMALKYAPGCHPSSRRNLKKTAGPGRPKKTIEEKVLDKEVKKHLVKYLKTGLGAEDFERARQSNPRWALEFAADRVWGKPGTPGSTGFPASTQAQVAVLVQVLSGVAPSKPKEPLAIEDSIQTAPASPAKEKKNT